MLLPWRGWLAGTKHSTAFPAHRQPSTSPRGRSCLGSLPGGQQERPTRGTGRGKVGFTFRASRWPPSANTLAPAPVPCLGSNAAISSGMRWERPAAVCKGNLSSSSKMAVGRNRLCNLSSPSSSSPEARHSPQRAGVSNHLPRRGSLSAWEKPQHLSRALERGFITSSGARADKVRRHAKNGSK